MSAEADAGKLTLALGLIAGFMAVEVAVGIIVSSLALLSDAAHMLTDAAAIGLSLVAVRLAARPAKGAMTYGLGRAEILSAQINGITLLVLALLIVYDAVQVIEALAAILPAGHETVALSSVTVTGPVITVVPVLLTT